MANTEAKGKKSRSEVKPFYLPSGTTSAEIVAEARTSVRSVNTKRPCTPVEARRTLFGPSRKADSHSRPPSAFSIGPRHFSESGLSTPTTPSHRLLPLTNAPDAPDGKPVGNSDVNDHVILQADRKVKQSVRSSKSLDPLSFLENGIVPQSPPRPTRPLEHLTAERRSSTGNIVKKRLESSDRARRAHSGPVERSSPKDRDDDTRARSSPANARYAGKNSEEKSKVATASDATDVDLKTEEVKRITRSYKKLVRPILKEMDDNLQQEDARKLCDNCLRLSSSLHEAGILPESMVAGTCSFKGQILKSLFSYLGSSSTGKNCCNALLFQKLTKFDASSMKRGYTVRGL